MIRPVLIIDGQERPLKAAPALTDLADGYRLAGKAGNFVKWIASVAAGLGALWAFVQIVIFGDSK